jgi:hypothetical protein
MSGLMLKWTGEARSDGQQRIRDLFPSGIPVIRRGDAYELDLQRVSPEILARCRDMAFGSIYDRERRQRLMSGPLVVAYNGWLGQAGLVADGLDPSKVPQSVDDRQLMLF